MKNLWKFMHLLRLIALFAWLLSNLLVMFFVFRASSFCMQSGGCKYLIGLLCICVIMALSNRFVLSLINLTIVR